jgi:hypothetical protein
MISKCHVLTKCKLRAKSEKKKYIKEQDQKLKDIQISKSMSFQL